MMLLYNARMAPKTVYRGKELIHVKRGKSDHYVKAVILKMVTRNHPDTNVDFVVIKVGN